MNHDDKNRSWCHTESSKKEMSRTRRLSSDFGQFLARRTDYESHQAKLRAASSSDTLAFDALNSQISSNGSSSLLSLNNSSSSGRVARWAVNIDAVLNDNLGKLAFSYFLKLEFSEENLQFWIDCEKLRKLNCRNIVLQKQECQKIIRKYIGDAAEMSINLPSKLEESAINNSTSDNPCFMAHQKHIYDLMKFDSYPRFIRSEHYRRLVEMELTNNYVTENDVTQAYKKGFDSQEDKKRKKSAFKLLKNAVNPIRYRRMSGELKNQKLSLPHESSENPNCYIHFSDGKNITVTLKEGIIVNDLLKDVALYHGVDNQNVDWLLIGENSSEEMTMERDCMVLKDKHIKAEMRVTFRLDILKLQRRIAIRAKTHKPIGETLKPIISKYTPELTMEEIIIRKENSSDLINLDDPVLKLSNQRIIMDTISLSPEPPLKKERNILKTSKKTKKRRESFGPLKRIRTKQSRDHGLMSESNPSSPTKENNKYDSSEYLRYPLARAEPEDITPRSRRSTTFGGQIDTQRGLLNRETLTLPKFLTPDFPPNIDDDDSFNKHRLDNNCSWDGNEDLDGIDGRIPNPEDAYKLFGNAAKGYSNNPCSTNTSYSSSNGTASSIEGSNSNLKQSVLPLPVYQRVMHGHESMEEATSEWEIFSSGSLNRTKHFKDHFYDEAPTYDSLPSLTSQHLLKQCRRTMNPTISKSQSSPANLSKDVGVYHTKITNTVYKKTKSTVV